MKGYLVFVLLFLATCFQAEAGFVIKAKSAQATVSHPVLSPGLSPKAHPLYTFLAGHSHRDPNDEDGERKTNSRGIASIICTAGLVVVLLALAVLAPMGAAGTFLLFDLLAWGGSIAAIVLGIRGLKRDRNRGYSIVGLTLGASLLGFLILTHFLLLLWVAGGYV